MPTVSWATDEYRGLELDGSHAMTTARVPDLESNVCVSTSDALLMFPST